MEKDDDDNNNNNNNRVTNLSWETPGSINAVGDVLDQLFAVSEAGIVEQGAANLIENLLKYQRC